MEATELLKKDHLEVAKLFQRFQESRDERSRKAAADKICAELKVHTQIEEETFYPAVRDCGEPELTQMVEEFIGEHQRVREQIEAIQSDGGELESAIATLRQDVEHHISKEEGRMFPRLQEIMDERLRQDIGRRLGSRKRSLAGGPARARRRATAARKPAAARGRRGAKAAQRRGKAPAGKAKKRARGGRGR